jgi:DNA topoisomerase-1
MDGRYGPYVKWDKVNATIPKGTDPGDLTFDQALELIAAKQAAKGGAKKKPAAKTTAAKSTKARTAKKAGPADTGQSAPRKRARGS